MNAIIIEVDDLIAEMKALDKFSDDVFIQYFEKVGEMQERLSELEKENKLSSVEYKDCSDKLSKAFEKLKGKLSFCTLQGPWPQRSQIVAPEVLDSRQQIEGRGTPDEHICVQRYPWSIWLV